MAAGSASAPAELLRVAARAALLSGVPSTVHALITRTDPLAATVAAGRMVAPRTTSTATLLASAALAHAALSLGWTVVLRRLPGGTLRGAGYGLAIAALDLGLAHAVRGRRFDAIADLAVLPQIGDHVAFGVLVSCRTSGPAANRRSVPA